MNNKLKLYQKLFLLLTILLFCLVMVTLHALAQPDEIELNNDKVFHKQKKPPVMFPHGAHMDQFDCLDCHHRFQNGDNILDADDLEEDSPGVRCQDCHVKKNFRFSPDLDPTNRNLMQAYHKQCISCHRAQGGQKGPRTCSGCHQK